MMVHKIAGGSKDIINKTRSYLGFFTVIHITLLPLKSLNIHWHPFQSLLALYFKAYLELHAIIPWTRAVSVGWVTRLATL